MRSYAMILCLCVPLALARQHYEAACDTLVQRLSCGDAAVATLCPDRCGGTPPKNLSLALCVRACSLTALCVCVCVCVCV